MRALSRRDLLGLAAGASPLARMLAQPAIASTDLVAADRELHRTVERQLEWMSPLNPKT